MSKTMQGKKGQYFPQSEYSSLPPGKNPLGELAQTIFEGQMQEARQQPKTYLLDKGPLEPPKSHKEELLEDLIKTNLLTILQWVNIHPDKNGGSLTPYQQSVADLVAKYKVPSPYDN
jgi:hypothetical protein